MFLEKVKQQHATDFRGLDLIPDTPTPVEMEETERVIVSRYTDSEIKSMRRDGFSGLSVEQRAKASGLQDLYNVVYRNFSRNVHSGDFMELFLQAGLSLPNQSYPDYAESRNYVACEVAFESAFGIAVTTNEIFNLPMDGRLAALACSRQQIRESDEGRA